MYDMYDMYEDHLPLFGVAGVYEMVVVFDDGTHKYVPEYQAILWYDWQGEYHPL